MNTPGSSATISRSQPALILFLIDRSYSMEDTVRGDGRTLAQVVADGVNETLHNLCLNCIMDHVEGPRPYFHVGLIGYGMSSTSDRQAVEPAFAGALAGRDLVPSDELARNPLRIVERNGGRELDDEIVKAPEWLEPRSGYATPMCEAVYQAGRLAADHCARYPNSYPPIVINLTDGVVTDEPYAPGSDRNRVSLDHWAERLLTLRTNHGPLRFLNCYVSAEPSDPTWFPNSANGLAEPGRRLFDISSALPDDLAAEAARQGRWGGPGARALLVNASPADLTNFLEIGTRVDARLGD